MFFSISKITHTTLCSRTNNHCFTFKNTSRCLCHILIDQCQHLMRNHRWTGAFIHRRTNNFINSNKVWAIWRIFIHPTSHYLNSSKLEAWVKTQFNWLILVIRAIKILLSKSSTVEDKVLMSNRPNKVYTQAWANKWGTKMIGLGLSSKHLLKATTP